MTLTESRSVPMPYRLMWSLQKGVPGVFHPLIKGSLVEKLPSYGDSKMQRGQ